MKGITVKYFDSWDEVKEIIKYDTLPEYAISEYVISNCLTYKVYFGLSENPIKIKGFDEKGERIYECNIGFLLKAKKLKEGNKNSESSGKVIYVYRREGKTDKLESGTEYHFIVCNKDGQKLEHTTYHGKTKYRTHYYKYNKKAQLIEEVIEPSLISIGVDDFPSKYMYEYDKNGRKISQTRYDMVGSRESISKYYYDESDRIIKDELILIGLYNNAYHVGYRLYDYKYSNNGNLMEEIKRWYGIREKGLMEEGNVVKIKYFYGKETNLLKKKIMYVKVPYMKWCLKGKWVGLRRFLRVYMKNVLQKKITHITAHLRTSYIYYIYDCAGRLLKEEHFDSEGVDQLRETYEYNDKGQEVRFIQFLRLPDGAPYEWEAKTKYDEKGRICEQIITDC